LSPCNPTLTCYRLGYSRKGWVDGEINLEYIKDFHEQTKGEVDGRTCLLAVDGHNSHYTKPLLDLACKHRIHVICYPAHATHIYQGLDVVVFGPLKLYWTQEKEEWARTKKQPVTKENFLVIYGRAHEWALTESTIKAVFRKTGLWLFNRNVVTSAMMALSLETSVRGHLPVASTTLVRMMMDMMYRAHERAKKARIQGKSDSGEETDIDDTPKSPTLQGENPSPPRRRCMPAPPAPAADPFATPIRHVIPSLRATSAAFLVSSSSIQASSMPPRLPAMVILPEKARDMVLLSTELTTTLECELQNALRREQE
jgi:hypothetical protein